MKRLSIFVSGNGTNMENIADYFWEDFEVKIENVVCNNPEAYAIKRAKKFGIPVRMITKQEFNSEAFIHELQNLKIDMIVLAGFLWKVPDALIKAFPKRIVNIHPALLPKYGGKGFYGEHVHEAVIAAKEAQSGITVHYVNEIYDSGEIILQARVSLDENETPDSLAAKIHQLEQAYFPVAIEQVLLSQN